MAFQEGELKIPEQEHVEVIGFGKLLICRSKDYGRALASFKAREESNDTKSKPSL